MIPVSPGLLLLLFSSTTNGKNRRKRRKGMGWEGGTVRRASKAEQCGLADNMKDHNLFPASANLAPATPHTQTATHGAGSRLSSPLPLLPPPCPSRQISSLSLQAKGTGLGGGDSITWTGLPSPPRCLAGAHMINDICHSVRREGWVSDV